MPLSPSYLSFQSFIASNPLSVSCSLFILQLIFVSCLLLVTFLYSSSCSYFSLFLYFIFYQFALTT